MASLRSNTPRTDREKLDPNQVEPLDDQKASTARPPSPRISAPSTLLLGDTGSGKTNAVSTLVAAGLETFVIVTEPNGLESLIDGVTRAKSDLGSLRYKVISPTTLSISDLMKKSSIVNTKDAGAIQQMSMGLEKNKFQQFAHVLQNLQNFHDDATGLTFGDVTTWGDERALVIDSLTGLNYMAVQYTAGNRPTMTMPEFGLAQTLIRDSMNLLTSLNCWFVLTAHLEQQADEITGGRRLFPLTIGRALAPELPRFFSEIILTKREGNKFMWSTSDDRAVVKHRALPQSDSLHPSFKQLKEAYDKRKAQLTHN